MKTHLIAAGVVSLCLIPGTASATVINFDVDGFGNAIAANTPITNQYANLGVIFAGWEDGNAVDIAAAPDPDLIPEPSMPNVLTNCSSALNFCEGNRADVISITFANAASDISFMLDTLGGDSVTFNLYDSTDMLLETLTISSGGSVYIPVSFASSGVSRIEGLQPNDGWAWAMDDLSFTAVPEPATWGMMVLGLGMIGAALRRREQLRVTFAM